MWAMGIAAALGLAACGDDDDDGGAAAPAPTTCTPPATSTVFFAEDVHPMLQTRCTPCHSDTATTLPKFASTDRTTSYTAARAAVNTTTPAQSQLLVRGNGGSGHADQLLDEHVQLVTSWVTECAQNNSATDPTPVGTTP
jgi:hypothetical protein